MKDQVGDYCQPYATHLLNNSTSVSVFREFGHLALHPLDKDLLVDCVTMLEELLKDIIAKYILHQGQCVGLQFAKDVVFLVGLGLLQLRLNEKRSMMVAAELNDIADYILRKSVMMPRSTVEDAYPKLPTPSPFICGPKILQEGTA